MGMSYGQAVRYVFARSGMTQAELARRGGFSTAYVSMLLSGEINNPKFDRACEVSDALGISIQDFYDLMYGPSPADDQPQQEH